MATAKLPFSKQWTPEKGWQELDEEPTAFAFYIPPLVEEMYKEQMDAVRRSDKGKKRKR